MCKFRSLLSVDQRKIRIPGNSLEPICSQFPSNSTLPPDHQIPFTEEPPAALFLEKLQWLVFWGPSHKAVFPACSGLWGSGALDGDLIHFCAPWGTGPPWSLLYDGPYLVVARD